MLSHSLLARPLMTKLGRIDSSLMQQCCRLLTHTDSMELEDLRFMPCTVVAANKYMRRRLAKYTVTPSSLLQNDKRSLYGSRYMQRSQLVKEGGKSVVRERQVRI